MSTPHQGYYAIIPAPVRYHKGLSAAAKLLYAEITALCSKTGYCWAANSYFAEMYDVHVQTISTWITQLRDNGFINACTSEHGGQRWLRIVEGTPLPNLSEPTPAPELVPEVKDDGGVSEKTATPESFHLPPERKDSGGVSEKTHTPERKDSGHLNNTNNIKSESIYTRLFEFWVSFPSLIQHKNYSPQIKLALDMAMRTYTEEQIRQSIGLYAEVLREPDKYFWSHRWAMIDFLYNGIRKFLPEANPLTNFLKREIRPASDKMNNFRTSGSFDSDIAKYGTPEQKEDLKKRKGL
jgi:hypothetical protein